jgi:Gamma-glutamyl cyclotransferase, AIG2-like
MSSGSDLRPDQRLPLFAYGALKPGELAYFQIVEFIESEPTAASTTGHLRLRDGLPLLERDKPGAVVGALIEFRPDVIAKAWETIENFEPKHQYTWGCVDAVVDGRATMANALIGKSPGKGSQSESVPSWSSTEDPVFVEAMVEVERLVNEARAGLTGQARTNSQPPHEDEIGFWPAFFRLQAALLLLWTIVERYSALRFGPGLEPSERIRRLNTDNDFRSAAARTGVSANSVFDSRNPSTKIHVMSDGANAAKYWYQIRCNLSHRAKSAFRDLERVDAAAVDLHATMRIILAEQLPAIVKRWDRSGLSPLPLSRWSDNQSNDAKREVPPASEVR